MAALSDRPVAPGVKELTTITSATQREIFIHVCSSSGGGAPPEIKSGQEGPKVILSPEQSNVLEMVKDGKNVFFTGSAGKS